VQLLQNQRDVIKAPHASYKETPPMYFSEILFININDKHIDILLQCSNFMSGSGHNCKGHP